MVEHTKHLLDYSTALNKIVDHLKFVSFFVGAGVSHGGNVPLASGIVDRLVPRIHRRDDPDQTRSCQAWEKDNPWVRNSDAYAEALQKAFGDDADDRLAMNEYFDKNFLNEVSPTFSHFALGLLIKHGLTGQTCITTNFDRLIERACMQIDCDCIPIRTSNEVEIWNPHRRHVIKVHGDSHYYNMKHTEEQTEELPSPLADLILHNRDQFPGMIVLGLGGYESSIQKLFRQYLEAYPTGDPRTQYRGVYWAVFAPEAFPGGELDETMLEGAVSERIVAIFTEQSRRGVPCYFFPIADARTFFFDLTNRIKADDSSPEAVSFGRELNSYYREKEWWDTQIERMKSLPEVTDSAVAEYSVKLDKANARLTPATNNTDSPRPQLVREMPLHRSTVCLLEGDITGADVDIVVSSDDVLLMMMRGVAGAIRDKAGPELIRHVQKWEDRFPLNSGTVLVTGAGHLSAKHVFHAALLDFRFADQDFASSVSKAARRSLELMKEMSCRSICFPLLAAGTAGFSPQESAEIIVAATRRFLARNRSASFTISICAPPHIVTDARLSSLLHSKLK